MYVGAKLTGNVCYHLVAHGLITYVNVAILMLGSERAFGAGLKQE
jgi:hypothetical protein